MMKIVLTWLLCVLISFGCGALPIIPGVDEDLFGMDTVAGSGRHLGTPATTVCKVTNLNDSGSGSLRECLANATSPITVIFEVSGYIELSSDLWISKSYVTIAGQTAPSPGITIRDGTIAVGSDTHHVLIQHLRFRRGENNVAPNIEVHDTMRQPIWSQGSSNIVWDHISFSWGIDEIIEFGGDDSTIINSIVSEALDRNRHTSGGHSKGLFCVSADTHGCKDVAIVQNLFAHNVIRCPEVAGGELTIANNLLIDCQNGIITYDGDPNKGPIKASIVGNYIIEPSDGQQCIGLRSANEADTMYYLGPDNFYDGQVQTDPWGSESTTCLLHAENLGEEDDVPLNKRASTPQDANWPTGYTAMSAADARVYVQANAGARPADRDAVDTRIVNYAIAGSATPSRIDTVDFDVANCVAVNDPLWCCTGSGTGDCRLATGGWPTLAENTRTLSVPENKDDVMPSGYTRLEEWLHIYSTSVEQRSPGVLLFTK